MNQKLSLLLRIFVVGHLFLLGIIVPASGLVLGYISGQRTLAENPYSVPVFIIFFLWSVPLFVVGLGVIRNSLWGWIFASLINFVGVWAFASTKIAQKNLISFLLTLSSLLACLAGMYLKRRLNNHN